VSRCTIEQAGVPNAEAEARPDGLDRLAAFRLQHHFDQLGLLGVRQLAGLPGGRLHESTGGVTEVAIIAVVWPVPCSSGLFAVIVPLVGADIDADLNKDRLSIPARA
jgi:hypothetical protein